MLTTINLMELHQTCLLNARVQLTSSDFDFRPLSLLCVTFALALSSGIARWLRRRVHIHHPLVPHLALICLPPHMHYHLAVVGDVDRDLRALH
jgi:hypothetical protein